MEARLDSLGIDGSRQRQFHPERSLTNADRLIDRALLARGRRAATFDDQRVLEELHLEVVLVDTREVHDDLHRRRGLVRVRIRAPSRLDAKGLTIARPYLGDRPRLARAYRHRVTVTQAPIAHLLCP